MFDRTNPFLSRIKERVLLTQPTSTKQTYHIGLDIRHAGLLFKTGDSIAVLPDNDPILVQRVIDSLRMRGDETIQDPRGDRLFSLRDFVTKKVNLSRIVWNDLHALVEAHTPLPDICKQFSPLLPRFYSIASSLKTHPDELHLTVALFTTHEGGEPRFGVASHFLCHLATPETPIPIYIHPSRGFTLPTDSSIPIIMVGPGTGVAPFRAFVQQRLSEDAPGKNWLFFGERNQHSDFFYEDFWRSAVLQGKLKLATAFSRDQDQKIYVQHRLYEERRTIWKWLEEGAYFYVCGDAHRMAKDVEATLHTIAKEEGGLSDDAAKAYIKALRTSKRYLLDVY